MISNHNDLDWQLGSYDYDLPSELIAQTPAEPRDSCRLLVYHRQKDKIEHQRFFEIGEFLRPKDLLVLNDTKVIPARIFGTKNTGGRVEIFLLEPKDDQTWDCLIRPGRRLPEGTPVKLASQKAPAGTIKNDVSLTAVIGPRTPSGSCLVSFPWAKDLTKREFFAVLAKIGQVPLPPYIKTAPTPAISQAYQTIFAQNEGAVAAPTAGLHFSRPLLEKLAGQGIETARITLHTGWGTFQPMKSQDIRRHQIHPEFLEIDQKTAAQINQAIKSDHRIIAVGTTVLRALESAAIKKAADPENQKEKIFLETYTGATDLYVFSGYQFKIVKNLLTNFHLPRSSLLAMVSALIGRAKILEIYQEAIKEKYRFFSFGDAMLILA